MKPRFGSWRDELEAPAADDRRAASRAVVRNKGLAPHRTNKYRNPRVKKKIKYAKAVVRRKGQVREMRNEAEGYGGRGVGRAQGRRQEPADHPAHDGGQWTLSRPILVAPEVRSTGLAACHHPFQALGRAQVRLGRALFNDSDSIVALVRDALVAVARRRGP